MSEDEHKHDHDRIKQLEETVSELKARLSHLEQLAGSGSQPTKHRIPPAPPAVPSRSSIPDPASPPPLPAKPKERSSSALTLQSSEFWLSKVGIALVLFGVAFGFKYSIDQGWLTPVVRHLIGTGIGTGLLIWGFLTFSKHRRFSLVLIGGGLAAYYITIFSAFQLFALISHQLAFTLMTLVTVGAFLISVRQNQSLVSVIGTLGGLGTPFLLYTGSGSLAGLMIYTCLILLGTAAVFWFKGWLVLEPLAVLGGWTVFIAGWDTTFGLINYPEGAGRLVLQLTLVFFLCAFWLMPVIWIGLKATQGSASDDRSILVRLTVMQSLAIPLATMVVSFQVWGRSHDLVFGLAALGLAGLCYVVSRFVRNQKASELLMRSQNYSAVILIAFALTWLFDGNYLLIALTLELLALLACARITQDHGFAVLGHLLAVAIGFWMAQRFAFDLNGFKVAFFNADSIANLGVIIAGFVAAGYLLKREAAIFYFVLAHVGVMTLFASELHGLENSQGYLTIAWGIYAIAMLVTGLRKASTVLGTTALVTLLVVVGKLFLVDLATLETLWRVLLFLGFGFVFLLLSHYFKPLWKKNDDKESLPTGQ